MTVARIGIMSFAHLHAHAYATCLRKTPNAELAGIWDDDPVRGKTAAKQYNAPFKPDIAKFLASGLDGVIVCSENIKHRPMVEAAANAGLWVLCEKPIATTVPDALAMIAACENAGVGLGIAFPCRYIAPLIEARDRIANRDLGRLLAAVSTNNGSFPGGWFADPKLSGGGAVMDHTVHIADALRWITRKEFTQVYCACNTLIHNIQADDVGSLQLKMDGDMIVSHVASWNRPDAFPTWGDVTIEFLGTKGTLSVDAFNQKIDVYANETGKGEWVFYGDDPNLALIADFADAATHRRPPSVTGTDGLRALEVTLAAYESAKTGQPAPISLHAPPC